MAISENEIAQVRSATDIVALISETVALKRTGQRWTGLCPFHGEKTPSFSVNAEEGRYYCFGCRASGDQITWVREIQHLEFIDALRQLADRAGIELHEDVNAGPERKERQEAMAAMDRAVTWYHEQLLTAPSARGAREYLRSRGIDGDVARRFKLGWAPDEWDGLATALDLKGKVLSSTGLGFINKRDRRQDSLRARVIFPIFDSAGKAIAVGGRVLPSAGTDEPRSDGGFEPKYKNSPETPIYSKRRTLYALNFAKDDIIKSDEIIVCEGYTDVIAFFTAGMPRAVATCGTALGEEHFRMMSNFSKRIVLAYDADTAGKSAAASVYQWERQNEVDVYVASLPNGSDPADLAQSDPEELRRVIREAVPFLRYRLDRVLDGAKLNTAEGRVRAAELAMRVLAEHPSELVRDQYIQDLVGRLGIDQNMLRVRVRELANNPRGGEEREIANEPPTYRNPRSSVTRPGLEALRLIVHGPSSLKERFIAPYFLDEVQRDVFEALTRGQNISELIDGFERRGEIEQAQVLSELVVEELDYSFDVTAVIAQLIRSAVRTELAKLDREMLDGRIAPTLASAIDRDVKLRAQLLETAQGESAENELRKWLLERASLTSS
jgi:DNA primase